MPTYQYRCTDCGDDLEVVQRFSDDPLTVCPACHGKLRKVFNAVGVVFKGSGFYKTDSRSDNRSGSGRAKSDPAVANSASTAGSASASTKDKTTSSSSSDSAGSSTAKPATSSSTSGASSSSSTGS